MMNYYTFTFALFHFFFLLTPLAAQSEGWKKLFNEPYLDIDEWRETPVKHRYVHGGFKGTDTRFSFYLPPIESYQGRFFQYITPAPIHEFVSQGLIGEEDRIGFALTNGAYFIETNGGGRATGLVNAYGANAACAFYSRIVATDMYGDHRPYGYAFGGSGGGYRTIGGMENTENVWDGGVPFVIGSPMAMPNVFSVRMHAMRILKNKFPQIIDALEPGGSGNMYEGLSEEEAEALCEVTAMGFPPLSWFGYETMGVHGFTALYPGVVQSDKSYFKHDFWNVSGYLGANPDASIHKYRLQFKSKIKAPISEDESVKAGLTTPLSDQQRGSADAAWKNAGNTNGAFPVGYQLEDMIPDVDFLGGDLFILSGEAAGTTIPLIRVADNNVIIGHADFKMLAMIREGDEVQVDNSNFLAAQTYHRHQVPPGNDYPVYDMFKDENGNPVYPQRPFLLGPAITQSAAGTVPSGKFNGKMIVVCCLWDREAYPWQGDWYYSQVKKHLGNLTDNSFRLWYVDRALHGDFTYQEDPTRTVSFLGVLQQALLDLSDWVERGVIPPATSSYEIKDGQVILPNRAEERKGIQPIVNLTSEAEKCKEIKRGTKVKFQAAIDLPPNSGKIVSIEWNFEGNEFSRVTPIMNSRTNPAVAIYEEEFVFNNPGIYFPTVRVASQRSGDQETSFTRIQNLDRMRIIVQ